GGVVTTSTQTQPGLPATSSPDAELRGISRACREAIFVHDLAVLDFGLTLEVPRIWSDSSTGITAAKRIGPGTKLRHLDVSEFYVQGAVQAGKVLLRKVKGTENPANYLTKHPKTGNEVAQALPSLAMVDPNQVTGNTASERHSVKLVRTNPPSQWKPVLPFKPSLAIAGATVAQQILGVRAQPREEELIQWTLQTTMLLGLITWLVLLWFVCRWATGCCSRALRGWRRQEAPQPEHEPSESEEEPVVQTPPVAVENLFRTPVRAEPPRDLRPPAPEPEPLDGEAGAAAEAAEPAQEEPAPPPVAVAPQGQRVRRRRLQPGARLPPVPQHNHGEMYYAPTRRTVHLYRNCVGLASVPQADIIVEDLCLTCWGGMIIGTRHEDSANFFVVGENYTPHVFQTCGEIRGWARGYPEVTWDLKTRDPQREAGGFARGQFSLAWVRVEPPFFKTSRNWDEEEDWNRDRWRSRTWWETAEQDQRWSWQQDTWQQDGQDWDQRNSWQYEAWGQDSNDPTDPWQGWEGVAAWNERQAAKSDPPRKKGRAWWERPPPEYHWKDGEWKKKNTRGVRSLQKQAERIERGQKRRLENPHREREEPPAPEAPAAPPEEESSEESLDTGAPPVVLQEAPVPQNRADEESGESSSESSSSSSSEEEPEPLPSNPAVSQQAERIRAVRLESSESEGKPNGPFSPPRDPRRRPRNKAAREEPPRKAAKPEPAQVPEPRTPEQPSVPEPRTPPQAAIEPEPAPAEPQHEEAEPEPTAEATASGDPSVETKPEPTELEEAARAADGAFVVVKEKPDYSEDEPLPQADPPAAASWVFVRDLLDEAAADPEAPASPAQAPEERVDPPKRVEPPKAAAMATPPQSAPTAPLTEAAVGRQLAELTAALQRAEASHREMRMGQAGGTAAPAGGTASSAAPPAVADDWERFVWQLETYAALVDSSFPGHLEEARRESDEADEAVESEECRQLSVKLFSMLEWESDLAKYEAEFGVEKAISDEDKRALLMVESPGALKQHLAMTAGKLTKYEDVRGLVVSYLQAKRVWTPSGAYAQPAGRRHHDPDAMDIGK
ncbi:unnamed protein product, partial [Symbiodinium microadriaticum]